MSRFWRIAAVTLLMGSLVPAGVVAAPDDADPPVTGKPAADRDAIDKIKPVADGRIDLPALSELYVVAKNQGVLEGIEPSKTPAKFDGLDKGDKALKVGAELADVAALMVLELIALEQSDVTGAKGYEIAEGYLERAGRAMDQVSRPEDAKRKVAEAMRSFKEGKGSSSALNQASQLLDQALGMVEDDENYRDEAYAVMLGAFLRTVDLTATAMSKRDITSEQLVVMRQSDLANQFVKYFEEQASPLWKARPSIKKAVAQAKQVRDLMNKPKFAQNDVSKIASVIST